MVSAAFAAAGAEPFSVRVACIGDSITYGVGTDDRETESYPSRLQQLLGDGYEVGNFGKSGATLLRNGHRPYTEQPEFADALSFVPDIAVIHLGVNDTDPRDWPNFRDEFVQDYLYLINSLRSVNEDVRILIAEITPITSDHRRFCSGTELWQREIRSAIRTVAEVADVQLVDFFTPLFPHPDLIPDAVHPDSRGAMILASAVFRRDGAAERLSDQHFWNGGCRLQGVREVCRRKEKNRGRCRREVEGGLSSNAGVCRADHRDFGRRGEDSLRQCSRRRCMAVFRSVQYGISGPQHDGKRGGVSLCR